MSTCAVDGIDADAIVESLPGGDGALRLTGLFSPGEIAEARRTVMEPSDRDTGKVTRFQGVAETEGAIADDRVLPGGPGQEPPVNCSYPDFHAPETRPKGLNASYALSAQVSVILDPFTDASGVTVCAPGTRRHPRRPAEDDDCDGWAERMTRNPGDVALFLGPARHCAMLNRAVHDRSAVPIRTRSERAKPMEDMPAALFANVIDGASPDLRQRPGLNCLRPEVPGTAAAGETVGRP